MWKLALGLSLIGFCAAGDTGWVALKGKALLKGIAGHKVVYQNGATQTFSQSGDTQYDSGHLQPGHWKAEDDRYCSLWPPSEIWACYDVTISADGQGVRFIADDGSVTEGVFASP